MTLSQFNVDFVGEFRTIESAFDIDTLYRQYNRRVFLRMIFELKLFSIRAQTLFRKDSEERQQQQQIRCSLSVLRYRSLTTLLC